MFNWGLQSTTEDHKDISRSTDTCECVTLITMTTSWVNVVTVCVLLISTVAAQETDRRVLDAWRATLKSVRHWPDGAPWMEQTIGGSNHRNNHTELLGKGGDTKLDTGLEPETSDDTVVNSETGGYEDVVPDVVSSVDVDDVIREYALSDESVEELPVRGSVQFVFDYLF